MRRFAILLLFLALPVQAQDRPVLPDDAPAVAAPRINARDLQGYGGYFTVSGTTGGSAVEWSVEPRPKGILFHQFPGAHALAFGGPPGTYTLTARVTSFKGKVTKLPKGWKEGDEVPLEITPDVQSVSATVILTGGEPGPGPVPPGPGPGPGPSPIPPAPPVPADPLVTALRDAAAADGTTKGDLAGAGDAAAAALALFRAGDRAQTVHDAVKAKLATGPALGPSVAAVLRGQTSPIFNPLLKDPAHVLTASESRTGQELLGRLANALYGASKQ